MNTCVSVIAIVFGVLAIAISSLSLYAKTVTSVVFHNDEYSHSHVKIADRIIDELQDTYGVNASVPFAVRMFDDRGDYEKYEARPNIRKVYVAGTPPEPHLAGEVTLYYFQEAINRHDVPAKWLENGMAMVAFSEQIEDNVYLSTFCRSGECDVKDILRTETDYIGMFGLAYHLKRNQPKLMGQIVHSIYAGKPAHESWIVNNVDERWAENLCRSKQS